MGPAADRLVGLDVARCLALLGMVATHLFDERTASGDLTTVQWVAGGRSSALFAVLAGVSLALMTRHQRRDRDLLAIAARAALIAVAGLALGGVGSGLAVILTYYGVLFLVGLPFARLGAPSLALLCAMWVLVGPVVSHLVRPHLPPRGFDSPTFAQLADPGRLASELFFTGYYPVVPWLAYLLAGLALGRIDLRDPHVAGPVALAGVGLAALSTAVSRALADPARAEDGATGMFGNPPADGDWSWLLLVAPHSSTPFDLVQTIGSAMLVIGSCLLVEHLLPRPGVVALAICFGAGAMTLTLYSLHVLLHTPEVWPREEPGAYVLHAGVLLAIGAGYAAAGRRGPLERLVGLPLQLARRDGRQGTR
jgi:hypothetical protein